MTLPLHKEEPAANRKRVATIREEIFEGVFAPWIEKHEWSSQKNGHCYPELKH
jgi:hypothetical protein